MDMMSISIFLIPSKRLCGLSRTPLTHKTGEKPMCGLTKKCFETAKKSGHKIEFRPDEKQQVRALEKLINNLTIEKPPSWQNSCREIQAEIMDIIEGK